MARLIKDGCEDNASFSALGRGLSLNFYMIISVRFHIACLEVPYLVQSFAILAQTRIDGLQVLIRDIYGLVERSLQLCKCEGGLGGIYRMYEQPYFHVTR
jgi:hypothetical protein